MPKLLITGQFSESKHKSSAEKALQVSLCLFFSPDLALDTSLEMFTQHSSLEADVLPRHESTYGTDQKPKSPRSDRAAK